MTEETQEPERHPCPDCGKMVTRTAAGKPRAHKCEPKVQAEPKQTEKKVCPQCGSAKYYSTLVGYIGRDENDVTCSCGWKGKAYELENELPKITADLVIAKYIETRDEIKQLERDHKEAIEKLKNLQEKRGMWLLKTLDENNSTSMKTEVGTVFVDYKDSATISDGKAFLDWVGEDFFGRRDYLETRVSKTMVKADVDEEVPIPPGVNFTRFKDVKVRRA